MKWLDENAYGLVPRALITIISIFAGMLGLCGALVCLVNMQGKHEETGLHPLPAVACPLIDIPKKVEMDDRSPYAADETLVLCRYGSRCYSDGMLMAEAYYDGQGNRFLLNTMEYDTAGNILGKNMQNETEGTQTRRYIYEYNASGKVVHQEIYLDGDLIENNYFRYTDAGRAGVSYSFLDEQIDGGVSDYCASYTEFFEDAEGSPLCSFKYHSLQTDTPDEVWSVQWDKQGDLLASRARYCKRSVWRYDVNLSDWYQHIPKADAEQFNLYERNPETTEKKRLLQLNYEWQSDLRDFSILPSFYRARYDEDRLLWQIDYVEGKIAYYSACRYDAAGRLWEAVEYDAEGDEPEALFHRYEYPEENREEQYTYFMRGRESNYGFGEEDYVRLSFSDDGILSEIEMTNVSENETVSFAFYDSGENSGKLQRMRVGAEAAEGEAAVLEKLEEEALAYGFQAGRDLNAGGAAQKEEQNIWQ